MQDIDLINILNCSPTKTEGTIINLNPDFLIPKEQLHTDQTIPHLKLITELHKRLENLNFEPQLELEIKTPFERWNEIKPIWSFLNNK